MDFDITKVIPKLGVVRLKDLIKQIRACKTAADERAVVAKESAYIRTSFKEENNDLRHINVAKLLYIHMLGYPAHFGQMECLKLVASPRFADKRLGYLGIMLLLDENQEVLTLVTNCLKNDLNSSNMYTVGLALCTLGNISGQEMARDLCGEVEKLLSSSNSYIRKKAALTAIRIIKKVPDLLENFMTTAKNLLNERNHGVLLTGIALLSEMCKIYPALILDLRKSVTVLVKHLKNLVTAGFSPEHDVSGITDPFLQVKVLRLLRVLGKGDAEASDIMNDVLAQVATNTEASKNVGNAILYETVLTIMDIESESSLRVLGINILGRFLANRDNNIRYVALTTLTRTAQASTTDSSALQRHRSTILDCLRDPDITIRRRALDLSFFLINPQNIRILTRELLSFLEIAESDIKSSTASRICEYAGLNRPNKRWEIDTVCRVLRVAGAWVDQQVINHFIKLVTTSAPDLQQYTVRKLYHIVSAEGEKAQVQEGLLQALAWCVGEFGDVLVAPNLSNNLFSAGEEEESATGADSAGGGSSPVQGLDSPQSPPTEKEVVDLFENILRGPYATSYVKEYSITALAKLTARFSQDVVIENCKQLVAKYRTYVEVEIQQRGVEYTNLFSLDRESRLALLERMPVLESAIKDEATKEANLAAALAAVSLSPTGGDSGASDLLSLSGEGKKGDDVFNMLLGGNQKKSNGAAKTENILDLLGDIGIGSAPTAASTSKSPTSLLAGSGAQKPTDLLGEIFGSSSSPAPAKPAGSGGASNSLLDLLGGGAPSPPAATGGPVLVAYDKNGLKITLSPKKLGSGEAMSVQATFYNTAGSGQIQNLGFQVAVPKTLKLQMHPLSSTSVSAGTPATQSMQIDNPSKVSVRLRIKVTFTGVSGQAHDEIIEFAQFDSSLWS
ncbi:adaptin N terminal region-domain-containing protein [Cladochytrium replicatum]|nr:adaptin N terminal region-domain-containing protein [Cladochytrium replicatum]